MVVEREKDKDIIIEPWPISQFQSKLVGYWADQQDDDEDHNLGRVEERTQLETSSRGKFRAKWVEDLVKGDWKRFESPNTKNQIYIGYLSLYSLEGATPTIDKLVEMKTNIGG